jgi:hypothetical protein
MPRPLGRTCFPVHPRACNFTHKCSRRHRRAAFSEQDPVAVLLANQRRLLDEVEEYGRYLNTEWPTPDFAEMFSRYKRSRIEHIKLIIKLFKLEAYCMIWLYTLSCALTE